MDGDDKLIKIIINLKIINKIPEQLSGRSRKQGTIEKSQTGHCTQTAESANVKAKNIFRGRNNVTCSKNCKYRTAATLFTLETWFVSGI